MGMREIAPFGLRMPPELRARIDAAAKSNGRSVNTEVIARLAASFQEQTARYAMEPATPAYLEHSLTEPDKEMLSVFRGLPAAKQLALLALFK